METAKGPAGTRHVLGRPMVYRLGIKGIGLLPRALAYWFADRVADLSFRMYPEAKDNVAANLSMVLPGASSEELSGVALKTFRNYARYLVDYGRFKALDREALFTEMVHIEGTENIDAVLERGKGLILLTAHLGNWELGGIFFGRQDIRINVLTIRDANREVDEIRERYRKEHNINTIVLGDSPFAVLEVIEALKRNEVVAMLVDRSGDDGIPVELFGRKATFPMGPVLLARETGAGILPAFVVREKGGYRGVAERPIYYDHASGDGPGGVAREVFKVFERYIRKYPDQWYNFVPI